MNGRPFNARRPSSFLTASRAQHGNSSSTDYSWDDSTVHLFSRPTTPQPDERNAAASSSLQLQRRRSSSSSSSRSVSAPASEDGSHRAPLPRILDFAKQKNPTLSVRLSRHLTWECTYAELLQYASALLTARRIARLYWLPSPSSSSSSNVAWQSYPSSMASAAAGTDTMQREAIPTKLILVNISIFVVAVASLDMRRQGEKLGLRRTSLMLCSALFLLACLAAVWPASSSSARTTARAAADMAKHGIDDFERAFAQRLEAWRTHGSAVPQRPRESTDKDSIHFQMPRWPAHVSHAPSDSIMHHVQLCSISLQPEQPQTDVHECQDLSARDDLHQTIEQMLLSDTGKSEQDRISSLCTQLSRDRASTLRVQLHNQHTVMILCHDQH